MKDHSQVLTCSTYISGKLAVFGLGGRSISNLSLMPEMLTCASKGDHHAFRGILQIDCRYCLCRAHFFNMSHLELHRLFHVSIAMAQQIIRCLEIYIHRGRIMSGHFPPCSGV